MDYPIHTIDYNDAVLYFKGCKSNVLEMVFFLSHKIIILNKQ